MFQTCNSYVLIKPCAIQEMSMDIISLKVEMKEVLPLRPVSISLGMTVIEASNWVGISYREFWPYLSSSRTDTPD